RSDLRQVEPPVAAAEIDQRPTVRHQAVVQYLPDDDDVVASGINGRLLAFEIGDAITQQGRSRAFAPVETELSPGPLLLLRGEDRREVMLVLRQHIDREMPAVLERRPTERADVEAEKHQGRVQ